MSRSGRPGKLKAFLEHLVAAGAQTRDLWPHADEMELALPVVCGDAHRWPKGAPRVGRGMQSSLRTMPIQLTGSVQVTGKFSLKSTLPRLVTLQPRAVTSRAHDPLMPCSCIRNEYRTGAGRSCVRRLGFCCVRRRWRVPPAPPEESILYGVVAGHVETFLAWQRERDHLVPRFVEREFRSFLDCGILARGFLRGHFDACRLDRLVPYSCKCRGFCPSCCGRRMADTAAHLVDRVFPEVPVRQWVLSVPFAVRYRLACVEVESTPEGPSFLCGFLHIRDVESGEDRLIPCGLAVVDVRWSPDGNSLLISGLQERKVVEFAIETGLYLVDAQTGKIRLVAERPDSRIVIGEWSADVKGIYFVDREAIVLHALETDRETKLLTEPHLVGPLALSPDGVFLAAPIDDREKSCGLITVNVSTGEVKKAVSLSRSPSRSAIGNTVRGFDWSADGKHLLYIARDEKGGTTLCRVPRQGGAPEKVWHTDKTVHDLRIHPDGKQLTVAETHHQTSVWVMEGLLSVPAGVRP